MAQILPHLLTMIHSAPDGAVQSPANPATIPKWVLRGRFAAFVAATLSVTRIVLGHPGKYASRGVFWTPTACVVAGSISANAGALT
jgi:hypothetical protein